MSTTKIDSKRKTLRTERRIKTLQVVWQTLATGGILGCLIWGINQPIWVVGESNQIIIQGNELLPEPIIKSLLALSYPQSLLRIKPEALAHKLELQPTIAEASVSRQLFPARLTVQVKERIPVAIAITYIPKINTSIPRIKPSMGLVDEAGVWIPIETYKSQTKTTKLPQLKVIGLPQQYRPYWTQLYQAVSRTPVKVTEINCQDQANIILKTELGVVHLGSYSSRLTEQLQVLDQMRQLSTKINPSQIAYIDLKDPETPTVQMNQSEATVKPDAP